jgi:hypothetical protein
VVHIDLFRFLRPAVIGRRGRIFLYWIHFGRSRRLPQPSDFSLPLKVLFLLSRFHSRRCASWLFSVLIFLPAERWASGWPPLNFLLCRSPSLQFRFPGPRSTLPVAPVSWSPLARTLNQLGFFGSVAGVASSTSIFSVFVLPDFMEIVAG